MKILFPVVLFLGGPVALCAWQKAASPAPVSADTIVLQAGDLKLTKSEYEKLLPGFDRSAGAITTGPTPASMQSGRDVARLLALVSEARRRKIDQDPAVKAQLQVRSDVLLANILLQYLIEDMKKDEAGTRAFYASEKHHFVEVHARHILVRYAGVKTAKEAARGLTRTPEQARERAAVLYRKLKDGADFAGLAKTESDDEATARLGGDLNYFSRGAMTGEFETVAYSLPVGGLSEPFKTEYGYHIVQVLDHRPYPFEKVRGALENMRARQRYEEIGKSGIKLNDSYFKP